MISGRFKDFKERNLTGKLDGKVNCKNNSSTCFPLKRRVANVSWRWLKTDLLPFHQWSWWRICERSLHYLQEQYLEMRLMEEYFVSQVFLVKCCIFCFLNFTSVRERSPSAVCPLSSSVPSSCLRILKLLQQCVLVWCWSYENVIAVPISMLFEVFKDKQLVDALEMPIMMHLLIGWLYAEGIQVKHLQQLKWFTGHWIFCLWSKRMLRALWWVASGLWEGGESWCPLSSGSFRWLEQHLRLLDRRWFSRHPPRGLVLQNRASAAAAFE